MNARYYDPSMGRFLSEDPLGLAGGDLTLYSYAGNNPVVFVDPSGLCASSGGTNRSASLFVEGPSVTFSGKSDLLFNMYASEPMQTDKLTIGNLLGVDFFSVGIGNKPLSGDNWAEFSIGVGDYLGVTVGKNYRVKDYFGQTGSYIKLNVGLGIGTLISGAGTNLRKK